MRHSGQLADGGRNDAGEHVVAEVPAGWRYTVRRHDSQRVAASDSDAQFSQACQLPDGGRDFADEIAVAARQILVAHEVPACGGTV